jgi:ammonia channel protein AmtB
MATAVISFQWFFWGYSLAFSHTAGKYIGDLENIGFRNVLAAPSVGSPKIPDLLFAVYQGMFAAITVALAVGAVAERGRMVRYFLKSSPFFILRGLKRASGRLSPLHLALTVLTSLPAALCRFYVCVVDSHL